MIIVNWSAVTGYVSHSIESPHRKPLTKVDNSIGRIIRSQRFYKDLLQKTIGFPRNRDSKGNHRWKESLVRRETKRKMG